MKKESDLFSIGEIAQAIGVTRRMILNYEDRGLIRPDVKDSSTGNRYYTIDTFTRIRNIRMFQDLGLSLDEIRGYYDDTLELAPLIRRLERLRDELELHIEKLNELASASSGQIRLCRLPGQTIYRRDYQTDSVAEKTVFLRNTALEAMRAYGTDKTQRLYFLQYPIDRPEEVSFCVAVPPDSRGAQIETLPAMQAVMLCHHGAYEELPAAAQTLLAHARAHGLRPKGTLRHIYLEGPPQHKDASKFITQIALPIEETPL